MQALEVEVLKEREESQEALRKYKEAVHLMSRKVASDRSQFTSDGNVSMDIDATDDLRIAGIDRNDPILAWSSLHKAATLREE